MIKDLRLTFSSTVPIFETWLDRFRLKTLPKLWKSPSGSEYYILNRPTFRGEELGVRRHEFEIGIIRPIPDHPDMVELMAKGTAVEIRLLEISPGRLQFQMDCQVWLLVSYCLDLLGELHRTWPETDAQVEPYKTLMLLEITPSQDSQLLFGESLIKPNMGGVCIKRAIWMRSIYGPPAKVIDQRAARKSGQGS